MKLSIVVLLVLFGLVSTLTPHKKTYQKKTKSSQSSPTSLDRFSSHRKAIRRKPDFLPVVKTKVESSLKMEKLKQFAAEPPRWPSAESEVVATKHKRPINMFSMNNQVGFSADRDDALNRGSLSLFNLDLFKNRDQQRKQDESSEVMREYISKANQNKPRPQGVNAMNALGDEELEVVIRKVHSPKNKELKKVSGKVFQLSSSFIMILSVGLFLL